MHSIYATGSSLFARPLVQSAYRFVAQEHVSRLLVSSVFAATILYEPTSANITLKRRKLIDAYRPSTKVKQQNKTDSPLSAFLQALAGNFIRYATVSMAFSLTPISIPTRLKTIAFSIPFFSKVAGLPVIRSLSLSHIVLLIIAGVQTTRHIYDIASEIRAGKQTASRNHIAGRALERIGNGLSVIAYTAVAYTAFRNIGTWKQTGGALCVLVGAAIASAVGARIVKGVLNEHPENFPEKPRDYLIAAGAAACTIALIRKSWFPQAEVNVATAALSMLNACVAFDRL